ncbi:MAG: hypothetical protein K0R00_74 [Herbinix sp.]|jgi:hypothetical protein|nr:hypothetical protein [Herbinix sp.]
MMRKCQGSYYVNKVWAAFEDGLFHPWGSDYEEFDNGAVNFTVAIVELPNGGIIEVLPEKLRFTDKDEQL